MYKYILFVCAISCGYGATIPSFITPCSVKDAGCLSKSATATLKHIIPGNKELKTPNLKPLILPLVDLKGSQLQLTLKDLHVHGLEDAHIKSVKFDTEAKTGQAIMHVPNAQLIGDYELTGKILVITLNGQDRCNITAVNGDYIWDFTYDIQEKSGQKHLKIIKHNTTYKIERVYFQFENLFKNDPALTKSTNEVLNAEWQVVLDDLGVGVAAAIGDVYNLITTNIFSKFLFEDLTKP